ncbi:MAG: class I tRNA ligase family protein, partial [bacterium]|nr:class I tRNA ligase family protein [bacterium]
NGFQDKDVDLNKTGDFDEFDLWALAKLKRYEIAIRKAYENFEFHLIYHHTVNFCAVTLSNLYFDVLKDRLYIEKMDSLKGRSSRIILTRIFRVLVKLLAPVLSFTSEDAWKAFLAEQGRENRESIHLAEFEELNVDLEKIRTIEEKWDRIFKVREEVNKALEKVKLDNLIGHTLEAMVVLFPLNENIKKFLNENKHLLPFAFIVSRVDITDREMEQVHSGNEEMKVMVTRASGSKCKRCWNYSETVGRQKGHEELCERCASIIAS